MNYLNSYELFIINESFDCKLYESKLTRIYRDIQKDITKRLGLNLYLVGTFQMGIVALCPVVEALLKNSQITVTKEQVVLLTIFAITQILNLMHEDVEKLRKELQQDGIIHLVQKVKDTLLSLNKIFTFVARAFGKIVNVFTDLIGYLSLAIPLYMVIVEMISADGLNIDTFQQKVALLGVGVGTFTIKSIIREVSNKIKEKKAKQTKEYVSEQKIFEQEDDTTVISAFPGMRLISGFPGIGKSHFFRVMQKDGSKKVLDSDSTNFSWIEKGVRNPDFPNNYINHIKNNMDKADIILISSHDVVRNALVQNKIPFILVYPDRNIKEEYIARYRQRGSDEKFVKLLEDNWDKFIDDCEKQKGCKHVIIHSGEYLSDKIDELS